MSEIKNLSRYGFVRGAFAERGDGNYVEYDEYVNLHDELDAAITERTACRSRIAELEAQVKAMRRCENCRWSFANAYTDVDKCIGCKDYSNWQPRAASKKG